jgi:hypothetical protein
MSWSGVVALFDRKEPGTALAWFRMGIALTLLVTLHQMWSADVIDLLWCGPNDGGYRKLAGSNHMKVLLSLELGIPMCMLVHRVYWICVASASAMLLGIGGRFSVLVTLMSWLTLMDMNSHAGGSYDELMANAMWLLVLAPSTATWSLDCWIRTGRPVSGRLVSAWVRYLAVFQLILMYWTTGLQKLSAYWTPGGDFSALYYILQQPTWQRYDMAWVAWFFPLTQLATAVTWVWEVSSPIWLLAFWYGLTRDRPGRLRRWFAIGRVGLVYASLGFVFHVFIELFMNVGPFGWASLAFYPCLLHPHVIDRIRGLPS